jgi:hypothetical protein
MYSKWCKLCYINYLKNSFTNWISGNDIIDDFIQKKQLKINNYEDIVVEWIPYNLLINIKKLGKTDDNNATIYSAVWKDGPLKYIYGKKIYKRKYYEKVVLKCLNNSQDKINEFFNKV